MNNFYKIILQFFIYSFIGYIIEIIVATYKEKKLIINRGFLIGPCLPIYGIGSLLITFFLQKYEHDIIALFIISTTLCSTLEYLTSLILEKIFNLRWWDYTYKKFNINGRICLKFSALFGIGGVLIIKFINPLINKYIFTLPALLIKIITYSFILIFIIDLIVTVIILSQIKINVKKFSDSTQRIKLEMKKQITKHLALKTRLLKSFPNIKPSDNSSFFKFQKIIFKAKSEMKNIKNKVKNTIEIKNIKH